jgi:mannitol-1-phosphate 5-dehydrogenase
MASSMSAPLAVVVGAGRVAGGFLAPLFEAAGWQTLLVGRDVSVVDAIRSTGAVWLRTGGAASPPRRVAVEGAVAVGDRGLPKLISRADLLATAVGPDALGEVGRWLGPLLSERFERTRRPINVVTFENHRRAPELLATGILDAAPSIAEEIGTRLGIGGAVPWRAIATRTIGPEGVTYDADDVDECYVEELPLLAGMPPVDGSLDGLRRVRCFDDHMVEKLWLFNAGHAAAAYLGWLAGCSTLVQSLSLEPIRRSVQAVVNEATMAFQARLACRPVSEPVTRRPPAEIIARYSDPRLADPVTRVGRDPRRKLAADDRLVGPAVACLANGVWPVGLATAIAAALAYGEPSDAQAADLRAELRLLGVEEVLQTVSGLHPRDELSRLVCHRFRRLGHGTVDTAA